MTGFSPRSCSLWPGSCRRWICRPSLVVLRTGLDARQRAGGVLIHVVVVPLVPPRVLPKLLFKEGVPRTCALCRDAAMLVPPGSTEPGRAPGGSLLANPDPHLRFALLTDFADAAGEHHAGGRGATAGRARRHPPAEPALRPGRAADASSCSTAGGLEPARAAGWAGSGSAASWWSSTACCAAPRTRATRTPAGDPADAAAHPLRHHARRRHAAAARGGPAADRHAGPSAQPAALRPSERPRGRRATASCSRASASPAARPAARCSPASSPASAGIDPYTTAVSDVYQDLFGEGQFHRQGDLRPGRLRGRRRPTFPENHILSHDLIEGNFARCGLVTRHRAASTTSRPATTPTPAASIAGSAATGRSCPGCSQWCRGALGGGRIRCRCSRAGRSSTTSAAAWCRRRWSLCWSLGWPCCPAPPLAVVRPGGLAVLACRCCCSWSGGCARLARATSAGGPSASVSRRRCTDVRPGAAVGRFLPHQALAACSTRSSARSCRLFVTPARPAGMGNGGGDGAAAGRRPGRLRARIVAAVAVPALAIGALVVVWSGQRCSAAAPLLVAWLVRRCVAYWVSQPLPPAGCRCEPSGAAELRRMPARPGASSRPSLAPRTTGCRRTTFRNTRRRRSPTAPRRPTSACCCSPTLAAYDLGYVGLAGLARAARKDPRHAWTGWIATTATSTTGTTPPRLQPLHPAYVSTVDSGNLAGCLLDPVARFAGEDCGEPMRLRAALGRAARYRWR